MEAERAGTIQWEQCMATVGGVKEPPPTYRPVNRVSARGECVHILGWVCQAWCLESDAARTWSSTLYTKPAPYWREWALGSPSLAPLPLTHSPPPTSFWIPTNPHPPHPPPLHGCTSWASHSTLQSQSDCQTEYMRPPTTGRWNPHTHIQTLSLTNCSQAEWATRRDSLKKLTESFSHYICYRGSRPWSIKVQAKWTMTLMSREFTHTDPAQNPWKHLSCSLTCAILRAAHKV